jgi:rhamnogalacturonan acetylesterase
LLSVPLSYNGQSSGSDATLKCMFCRLALFAALLPIAAHTQVSAAPPETPAQRNLPADAALNPALPTLFLVGDSTARNGANLGWGDHLAPLFDTMRINIANRAIAGRSSRTYINEGHWAKVLGEMKPGDFLLLQMGHNDGGDLGGTKPRGTLKGIGEETQAAAQTAGPLTGQIETVHTYGWYVRKMVDEAKAKGVHPMLMTLTIRNIWTDGKIERDMGYTAYINQIAAQEHIPVIDMAAIEADRLEALGEMKTALLFPIDHTHTSPEGADLNAHAVVEALLLGKSPLVAYLKP